MEICAQEEKKKQGTKNGHGPTTSTAGARPEMPGPEEAVAFWRAEKSIVTV